MVLISGESISQVTTKIVSMTYFNGTSISSCGNIDFGSNNTVRVQFGITAEKNTSQVVGPSNIYVYTIGASGNRIERKAEIVQTVSFDTYYSTSADITMNSSDFNTSGGTLFAVFKSSGNVEYQSCSYAITKTQTPTFTLNPATLSFSCGDTSSKTFSMSNVYNSPGTLTYQWNIGSGWNVASSTSTSRTLTPTSSSPGNVSVTPILNGVAQPTQTCVVSLAAYNPLIAVIGSATGLSRNGIKLFC